MAAWAILQDEQRGRHLQAQQHIKAGHQILRQMPYASVLYDDQQTQVCDQTFQPTPNLKRCAGCKVVWYSSRAAQKAAWSAHKQECKALARMAPRVPPPTVRLAARVLWRSVDPAQEGEQAAAAPPPDRTGTLTGGSFTEVQHLEHHWDQLSAARKTSFAQMAALTRLYMYGEAAAGIGVPTRDIAQLLAVFACNNHTICNTELQPLGVGLYPTGAMINHSCQPNAVQSFEGSVIVFRAVRTVEPGEEVTISYTDLKTTSPERRAFLLQHYHFDIDAKANAEDPQDAEPALVLNETPGGGVRLTVSVALWPPGLLHGVDQQLAGLPSTMAGVQLADAYMLADCDQSQSSRSSIAAGNMSSRPFSDGAGTTFSSMEAAMAALEAGEEGPDPRQHIRVQCWGQSFFASGSGSVTSSGNTRQAAPAGGPAAEAANDGGAAASGGTAGAAAADAAGDAGPVIHRQLVGVFRYAAMHCCLALDEAEQMLEHGDAATAVRRLQAPLAQFTKAFGPHHILLLRLRDALLRAAIAAQQWELALQTACDVLPTYQLIYTQPWPDMGLLWAHIAKMAALLQHDDRAAVAAERAAGILRVTHGDRCDVVVEMLQLRHDIQASKQMTLIE